MAKRANGHSEYSYNALTRTHTWNWGTLGVNEYVSPEWVGDEFDNEVYHNGEKQKIADAAAKSDVTVETKFAAQRECIAHLNERQWNKTRAKPSAWTISDDQCLVQAMVAISGKSEQTVAAYVEGKSEADRRALAASERFGPEFAKIKASLRPASNAAHLVDEIMALPD